MNQEREAVARTLYGFAPLTGAAVIDGGGEERQEIPWEDLVGSLKHGERAHADLMRRRADAILALRSGGEGWRPTHRHVKRGTEYEVLGTARVQSARPLEDMEAVIVYQDREGVTWVRPPSEFNDGRFEPLARPRLPMGRARGCDCQRTNLTGLPTISWRRPSAAASLPRFRWRCRPAICADAPINCAPSNPRTHNMTDAVKQAIERLSTIRSCTDAKLVWLFEDGTPLRELAASFYDDLAILIALQAERDKLAAEVERLRQRLFGQHRVTGSSHSTACSIWGDDGQGGTREGFAEPLPCNCGALENFAEAKVAALVLALEKIGREGENGLDMWGCRLAARQALAHHSAPVEEAGKTVLNAEASEVFVTALAEPPEPNAALWKAAAQHHLRALLFAARTSGGASGPDDYLMGVCARAEAFMVSAPPTTPTSAPVEDVGGLVTALVLQAVNMALAGVKAPGRAEACDVKYYVDRILSALSPSLIQPQGEERS